MREHHEVRVEGEESDLVGVLARVGGAWPAVACGVGEIAGALDGQVFPDLEARSVNAPPEPVDSFARGSMRRGVVHQESVALCWGNAEEC